MREKRRKTKISIEVKTTLEEQSILLAGERWALCDGIQEAVGM